MFAAVVVSVIMRYLTRMKGRFSDITYSRRFLYFGDCIFMLGPIVEGGPIANHILITFLPMAFIHGLRLARIRRCFCKDICPKFLPNEFIGQNPYFFIIFHSCKNPFCRDLYDDRSNTTYFF